MPCRALHLDFAKYCDSTGSKNLLQSLTIDLDPHRMPYAGGKHLRPGGVITMRGVAARSLGLLLGASTFVLGSPSTHAQSAPAAAEGAPSGDIVVTAQKKEERLQDVPVSVAVVSGDGLLAQNNTRLQDYYNKIPGLSLMSGSSGQATLAIRGVVSSSSTNPTVGLIIDDIPVGASTVTAYASSNIPDLDPASIAQIEVLRGPQGTLYGANSMGGLLKYVTVDPSTKSFSGRIQADAASVSHGEAGYGLRGLVNVPVSADLAIRANAFGRHDPGYVDNATTGEKNVNSATTAGGRVAALWNPTETLSWKLAALLQNVHGNASDRVDANYLMQPTSGDLTQTEMPDTGWYIRHLRLYSSNVKLDLGAVTLYALTGYSTMYYHTVYDYSDWYGSSANKYYGVTGATLENQYYTKKFTQEVRLATNIGTFADLTLGGYYGRERTSGSQTYSANDHDTGAVVGQLAQITSRTNLDEIAAFAAATLHFTDALSMQLGGRFTHNAQSNPRVAVGQIVTNSDTDIRNSSKPVTFLVSPTYKISSDLMVYGRIASGYRIGGSNSNAPQGAPPSYKPDRTINYEVGTKGYLFNRLLMIDLSAYYIDWKDIQLSFNNSTTGLTYFINGTKAKSAGVEFDATLRPMHTLAITGTVTYDDAELTQDLISGTGYGFKGDRLPFSSRWTSSASIDKTIPLREDLTANIGGTVTYVGDRYGNFQNSSSLVRLRYPGYTTLDVRAGIRHGLWTLDAFATNLTDKRGVSGGATLASTATKTAPYYVTYIRPRTWGISLARDF